MRGTNGRLEDELLADSLLSLGPNVVFVTVRCLRAAFIFAASLVLFGMQPSQIASPWTLAILIAGLSLFNLTKWVAAGAIAVLLAAAIVPPQVLAAVLSR